jgi:uncharacterized membrane protein YcaP (DUF421 family)
MDAVLRAAAIYLFLFILFRVLGKRSMTETDTFDFVILLIISEATQEAMIGDDFSLTKAFLVIATLLGLSLVISLIKLRSKRIARVLDGVAVVILEDGRPLKDRMLKLRIDENDILERAHEEGLTALDQIKYAILSKNGTIAIIPRE